MKIWRATLLCVAAALGSACKDGPTAPPPVATIILSVPSSTPQAGTSQTLVAIPRAANGTELRDRAVSWSSSNSFVAAITSDGQLLALAPGASTITATSEGKSAVAAITVQPAPVATITIATDTGPLVVGATRQLVSETRDGNGAVLVGRVVTWTSGSPATAVVTTDGLLTALAPGNVTVTAISEGKSASATLLVQPQPEPPVITSVGLSPLVPGTSATITGTGFSPNATSNRVTIRGVEAPTIAVTPTQLTVVVPCVSSGVAPIAVVSAGRASVPVSHPVAVTTRTVAVGQALVLSSSAASACNELPGLGTNARYLVAVFSASTSANTLVNFEIAGNTPAPGATFNAPVRSNVASSALTTTRPAAPHETGRDRSNMVEAQHEADRDKAHWEQLERDRTTFEQLQRTARPVSATTRLRRAAEVPVLGEARQFFFTFGNGCADTSRPIQTKAVYVGTRSVIWEDSANTLASANNSDLAGYYRRLGQIFDQDQYQSLKNTFGDPLLRDTLTDNDGRIHMVFTQRVNGTGAAAYVTSCDQHPRTVNPGSNFGEVFYGSVPVSAGSGPSSSNFPDGWFYFMARTVVHEVKHIVSIAARVNNNAPVMESSWLEEGTARHAEEMWVRESLHKVPWKGNTGFGSAGTNGIYCDFHPQDVTCNAADVLRRPSYGMRRQFNEIREKLLAPWNWSPYGDGTGQSGSVFYQTAWSLVRYTIDRYAVSDEAFFKTLINSRTNGATNLVATAGVPLDQLIGGWGLALFADDYPGLGAPSADLQFPTWNLRSIYAGLNGSPNWTTRFPTTFPIQPAQISFGSFVLSQEGLRGGAHAYYELSGASATAQLIQLRGAGGGTPSANLRIAIARLQ